MANRRNFAVNRFRILVVILTLITACVLVLSTYLSYQSYFAQQKEILQVMANGRAATLKAVLEFDKTESKDFPGGSMNASISQFRSSHEIFPGFGNTGEFGLARRNGDVIEFLVKHKHQSSAEYLEIPWNSELSEGMRRAISGKTGTDILVDYKGHDVLASYTPVEGYNLGIVIKIDMSELRAPFIEHLVQVSIVSFILILLGAGLFAFITEPVLKALSRNEKRLNEAQELANLGSWEWDISSGQLTWSEQVYKIFNLDSDTVSPTYEQFLTMVHPADRQLVEDSVNKAVSDPDYSYNIFHRIHLDNGSIRFVEELGVVTWDKENNPIKMLGTVLDVTEKIHAEQYRDQLNAYLDHSESIIAILDAEGTVINVSKKGLVFEGLEESSFVGKTFFDTTKFSRNEAIKQQLESAFNEAVKGHSQQLEIHSSETGHVFYVEAWPLALKSYKSTLVVMEARDITNFKKLQAEHQGILNLISVPFFLINSNGTIVKTNRAAQDLFLFSESELINNDISIIMPQKIGESHDEYVSHYLKTGIKKIIGRSRETQGMRKDGSIIDINISVSEIKDPGSNEVLFISFISDITTDKKNEMQIRRIKRLESLSSISSGAAHDFNNLLGVIEGYSELLTLGVSDSEKVQKFAGEISVAVSRGKKLTSQLLSFSKRKESKVEDIKLNDFMAEELSLIEKAIPKKVNISYQDTADNLHVLIAKDELADAILNMCINASHAMDGEGEISLKLAARVIDDSQADVMQITPGEFGLISISDTGTGISEDILDKIFEPYFSTKGDHGSGLGLSQVFGMVRRYEGTVEVDSDLGVGTTFTIFLPLCQEGDI